MNCHMQGLVLFVIAVALIDLVQARRTISPHRNAYSKSGYYLQKMLVITLVVAVVQVSLVQARTPNRHRDGYVKSGYYFPKMLIWAAIRTTPGRYWLAYSTFAVSAVMCLYIVILHPCEESEEEMTMQKNLISARYRLARGQRDQNFTLKCQYALMGLTLVFLTVVSSTLADVTLTYLVGICELQVLIDTVRFTYRKKYEDPNLVWFTLLSFAVNSIFAVALQDSYLPLNQVNAAYVFGTIFIIFFCTVTAVFLEQRCKEQKGLKMIVGTIGSLTQLGFCTSAFWVTQQVEGGDLYNTIGKAFFYTTVVMSGIIYFWSFYFTVAMGEVTSFRNLCNVNFKSLITIGFYVGLYRKGIECGKIYFYFVCGLDNAEDPEDEPNVIRACKFAIRSFRVQDHSGEIDVETAVFHNVQTENLNKSFYQKLLSLQEQNQPKNWMEFENPELSGEGNNTSELQRLFDKGFLG